MPGEISPNVESRNLRVVRCPVDTGPPGPAFRMPSKYDRFSLVTDFELRGDQARAIDELVDGLNRGDKAQVLLGVTGSGKTFTIANVIQEYTLQ